jgi:hypothetical protein
VSSTRDRVTAAYERLGLNLSAIARETGVHRRTAQRHLVAMGVYGRPIAEGRLPAGPDEVLPPPPSGVRRLLLSSAQNNTHVHRPFWRNLLALASHYDAEVWVSTFNYNVNAYGRLAVKRGKAKRETELWYAPEVRDHVRDEKVEVAPGLVWCGNLCLSPTAQRPLSGWSNYTRRKSGIFPHPKVAMESVAVAGGRAPKLK